MRLGGVRLLGPEGQICFFFFLNEPSLTLWSRQSQEGGVPVNNKVYFLEFYKGPVTVFSGGASKKNPVDVSFEDALAGVCCMKCIFSRHLGCDILGLPHILPAWSYTSHPG